MAHPSIHSYCFCMAYRGSCPVWRSQVILLHFAGSYLSGLLTKTSVFVSLCRALAQLFVLRDRIEVAGRGPEGRHLEQTQSWSQEPYPAVMGWPSLLSYLTLPSSLLS